MVAQETAARAGASRWKRFLREVRAEMRKVTWPGRKELVSYTLIVFVSVVVVAALIWIVDTGFAKLLRMFLQ